MNELVLSDTLIDEMINHAAAHAPEEACGLVGGRGGRAIRLYPVENVLHSPVAYEMAPQEQVRAMLDMEGAGEELLAIYHSHPHGPAWPSPTDRRQAYYPDTAYIIISLADPERPSLRAFMLQDGQTAEMTVRHDS
ncbi:MAG: M67 family metallopeptidase [Candidatus Promineofilum sp.]|nr:M67 family metallopeptidase [Promineifilum sp.]